MNNDISMFYIKPYIHEINNKLWCLFDNQLRIHYIDNDRLQQYRIGYITNFYIEKGIQYINFKNKNDTDQDQYSIIELNKVYDLSIEKDYLKHLQELSNSVNAKLYTDKGEIYIGKLASIKFSENNDGLIAIELDQKLHHYALSEIVKIEIC
jgi:hypothetical protein